MEPTHASFFSGVGGLDLGLERAGWRTVSFSEIEPYACAVLAERWPDVPNLGDITVLAGQSVRDEGVPDSGNAPRADDVWAGAHLWTGGFPCQDLSVAGKRAGFAGQRSSLAFAFLDLVERHRPPAVLLENVPGLLSSHRGRDMAALVGRLGDLGYGWAFRVLDARHFGVPQRRRRVFIVALRSGPDDPDGRVAAGRAAAVLAVGTRCDRHPPAGGEAREGTPDRFADGVGGAGPLPQAVTAKWYRGSSGPAGDEHHNLICPPSDPSRVRAADGLAGRLDDHGGVGIITALSQGLGSGGPDAAHAQAGWLVPIIAFDPTTSLDQAPNTETFPPLKRGSTLDSIGWAPAISGVSGMTEDDPLLPLGLDSHRYRCCGNGVVAPVAEWLGRRLAEALS